MVTPLPFAGGTPAVAFWLVYVVAFGLEAVRRSREDAPDPGTVRDAGSRYAIYGFAGGGLALAFWVASGLPSATMAAARGGVFALGLAVTLCGTAIRWYAVRTLGDAFHGTVNVREDQRVVDAGPYRWVRHPSYTGGTAMFLGFGLALTNWASVACVLLGTAVGYGYRVRVEEAALREELGAAYREYAERTPYRVVPFVY